MVTRGSDGVETSFLAFHACASRIRTVDGNRVCERRQAHVPFSFPPKVRQASSPILNSTQGGRLPFPFGGLEEVGHHDGGLCRIIIISSSSNWYDYYHYY